MCATVSHQLLRRGGCLPTANVYVYTVKVIYYQLDALRVNQGALY